MGTRKRNHDEICADAQKTAEKKMKVDREREERIILPFLPPETWLSVLAFIALAQVAKHTALVCRKFWTAADIRLHRKCPAEFPRSQNLRRMRPLRIDYDIGHYSSRSKGTSAEFKPILSSRGEEIKWPDAPVPSNIVAFSRIYMYCFDPTVLAFFRRIQPLLAKGVHIDIGLSPDYAGNLGALERVLPLCCGKILSFQINTRSLTEIVAKFPQLLRKCQFLWVWMGSELVEELDFLIGGLAELREDGRPKQLVVGGGHPSARTAFINRIREQFRFSTTALPSPFLVYMVCVPFFGPKLCEQNERTGEQLSMEKIDGGDSVLIARCALAVAQSADFAARKQKLINFRDASEEGSLSFLVNQIGNLDALDGSNE